MIKLSQLNKTKKVTIDIDGNPLVLEIKGNMTVSDQMGLNKKYPNMSDPKHENFMEESIAMLCDLIKDWNLHDEDGVKLDINVHNLGLLPGAVIPEITKAAWLQEDNTKKNSSS